MNQLLTNKPSTFIALASLVFLWSSATSCNSQTHASTEDAATLLINRPVSKKLSGGETHYYKVNLRSGEYAHLTAQQHGIDIVLTVQLTPDETVRVDRPNGAFGREAMSLIASQDREYVLRVESLEAKANQGTYSIVLDTQRPSLPGDKKMMAAEREITEAENARAKGFPADLERAATGFQQALALWRDLDDRYEQCVALYGLGYSYRLTNEYQKSISTFLEGLTINKELKDQHLEAVLLTGVGWSYVYLGDTQQAFDSFTRALTLRRLTGDKEGEALALYGVGWFYALTDDNEKALEVFNETLALRRETKSASGEALTLVGIAKILHRLGKHGEAVSNLRDAITILRQGRKGKVLAEALSSLGWVEYAMKQDESALTHFDEALSIWQLMEDRVGEATTRYGIARAETRLRHLPEAQQHMQISLELVEAMRARGENQRLRTSFFSMVQDYYEFAIDLLMRLNEEKPGLGYAGEAFRISERSRNRNLLDLLNEASVDIRQGVDPSLLEKERLAQQAFDEAVEKQRRSVSAALTAAEKVVIAQEVGNLSARLADLQAQIRKVSPHYALLTQARPVSAADVQQSLLDDDTMLLEYALGSERSYLWAITKEELLSYELPSRAEIDELARPINKLLTARNEGVKGETSAERETRIASADAGFDAAALRLSNVLLAPVAHKLYKRRLVIVSHSLLQSIPFAALPAPATTNASREPLLVKHEIVNLPSASVLAMLRQRVVPVKRGPTLAIVADPVFSRDDERCAFTISKVAMRETELTLPRLFNTRWEATKIASFVPAGESRVALDFAANRDFVGSTEFARSRFLHFATHTVIDDEHAELSGIALSNFDATGRKQDGFLRSSDIYHLRLAASLVTLSSCQSALGKEVKGEGLVGLTHGFMYAGAPRVVASLWTVSDNPTAQLMAQFYRGLLGRRRMSPAAALRAAQLSMLRDKRWQSPYFWSGFVLQGEWR